MQPQQLPPLAPFGYYHLACGHAVIMRLSRRQLQNGQLPHVCEQCERELRCHRALYPQQPFAAEQGYQTK